MVKPSGQTSKMGDSKIVASLLKLPYVVLRL